MGYKMMIEMKLSELKQAGIVGTCLFCFFKER
jgi:hypothetical protein